MNSETKTSYAGDETRSTGSMGKLNIFDLIAKFMPSIERYVTPWEQIQSILRAITYHRNVGYIEILVKDLLFLLCREFPEYRILKFWTGFCRDFWWLKNVCDRTAHLKGGLGIALVSLYIDLFISIYRLLSKLCTYYMRKKCVCTGEVHEDYFCLGI